MTVQGGRKILIQAQIIPCHAIIDSWLSENIIYSIKGIVEKTLIHTIYAYDKLGWPGVGFEDRLDYSQWFAS